MEGKRRISEGEAKDERRIDGGKEVEKNGIEKVNIPKKRCIFAICIIGGQFRNRQWD